MIRLVETREVDGGTVVSQYRPLEDALAIIAEREGVVFLRVNRELVPRLREWNGPFRVRLEDSHRPGEAVLILQDDRPVLDDRPAA
jgi:hypothetical protein